MTTACNWENRVRRAEVAIVSDSAWLGDRNISTPTGDRLPITGHIVQEHTYESYYEHATYRWNAEGNSRRIQKTA